MRLLSKLLRRHDDNKTVQRVSDPELDVLPEQVDHVQEEEQGTGPIAQDTEPETESVTDSGDEIEPRVQEEEALAPSLRDLFEMDTGVDPQLRGLLERVKPVDASQLAQELRSLVGLLKGEAPRAGEKGGEIRGEEQQRVIRIGDDLINLEKKLGGGIQLESLTLVEGAATAGKSVLCQHLAFGALSNGYKVAYFTSEHNAKSFATQMDSIGLDVSTFVQEYKLSLVPVQDPTPGEDSGPLLTALALDIGQVAAEHEFIIVDSITDLAASSQGQSLIGFFSSCKRVCDQGATIVVVSQSYAFDSTTITRLRSLCNAHLSLRVGKVRDRLVRMIEIIKVNNMELDRDNLISFSVEPKVGMRLLAYTQAKV